LNPDLIRLPFLTSGSIFRSPMPFSAFDHENKLFSAYQKHGIQVVVMLVDDIEAQRKSGRDLRLFYQSAGMLVVYLPIRDYSIPPIESIREAVHEVRQLAESGKSIVVHCHAGIGRTGTFLACLAKDTLKVDAEQAIQWVRQSVPGAVEVPVQINLVHQY
jgi:protein-tyrosine phosphatase